MSDILTVGARINGADLEWFDKATGNTLFAIRNAASSSNSTGIAQATMGSATQTVFGGTAAGATFGTFSEEGNLYRKIGNPIAGNAADTTDDVLGGIVVPASAFDVAGRGLCITAQGITGATTNNKRFKIFINPTLTSSTTTAGVISGGTASAGTVVCDSGTWVNGTTPNNAVGWSATVNLFKYGAAASNTQYAQGSPILGATHGGINPGSFLTITESGTFTIVVTGSSYTTGAASDVILNFLEVNALN